MNPALGTVLRGQWSRGGGELSQIDNMGGGCLAAVWADRLVWSANVTRPGLHSLYVGTHGSTVHWDEWEWRLRHKLRGLGVKRPKIHEMKGGDSAVFRNELAVSSTPIRMPECDSTSASMRNAQDALGLRLIRATTEQVGVGKPVILLSGGVDSISIMWALKEAGADFVAITAGRSEDDFDPYWAKRAAEHFGVPWELVQIPTDPAELQRLLVRTVGTIEQTSYSNVLMGMCCTLLHDWMVAHDRNVAFQGYYADLLFGHKLQTTGSFNLLPERERTDAEWSRRRIEHCWKTIPNTHQLAKNFRLGGETTWRAPFAHGLVADFIFNLPLEYAPAAMDKPLLYGMMDRRLPEDKAAWHVKRKIGFYTGAGIGKLRLEHPVLQDANIRNVYNALKQRMA